VAKPRKPSAYSLALQQVQEENVQTADQPTVQESEQLDSKTAKEGTRPVKQQTSQTAKRQRIKATFYLLPADIIAIDEMQTKRFREQGKKPEKSELVSEAIQLLSQQRTS